MNKSIIIVLYLFVYPMICVVNTEGWCIYGSHLLLIFDRILFLFSHFQILIAVVLAFIFTEFLNPYAILDLFGQNYVHIELYDCVKQW
jgi:hypothetical protein